MDEYRFRKPDGYKNTHTSEFINIRIDDIGDSREIRDVTKKMDIIDLNSNNDENDENDNSGCGLL